MPDNRTRSTIRRRARRGLVPLLLVGLLVTTAGCSGLGGGSGGATASPTTTQTATPTPTATPTATATPTPSLATVPEGSSSVVASGKITVVVDGEPLSLQSLDEPDAFDVAANDSHTWRATAKGLTLTQGLATFGVNARASALTFQETRYEAATEGTRISYRVDGEAVDPTTYELKDGDHVWVVVTTESTNVSSPQDYVGPDQQHAHGSIEFVVDGTTVNFSQPKYQENDRYFHFEGGDGSTWHAHSWAVTVDYALSSLAGIDVTNSSVTYEGRTYAESTQGTDVSITVNGDPVAVDEYVLKPGDRIRVVVQTGG